MLLLVSDDEAQDLRFLQPPSSDALSLQQIQSFFSGQSQDVCQVVQPVEHTLAFDDAHATIPRDKLTWPRQRSVHCTFQTPSLVGSMPLLVDVHRPS